jgi:hypothetical protein
MRSICRRTLDEPGRHRYAGTKPKLSPGRQFFDTGVERIADRPAPGVKSITADEGESVCW